MSFDYSRIPLGYYDGILTGPNGMRKFWHFHKFDAVMRVIPPEFKQGGHTLLDLGCFAGSFLGLLPEGMFAAATGLDILPEQIEYARKRYGNSWRHFDVLTSSRPLRETLTSPVDVVTLIEVIEHLNADEIRRLLKDVVGVMSPGGRLILTTPNYFSLWPVLEALVNRLSDVRYEEQHLTRFTVWNLKSKMRDLSEGHLVLEQLTTTHFLTPYVAALHYPTAVRMATAIPSSSWKNPFGNLILSSWRRA